MHRNMLRDPPVSVTVIGSAGPRNYAELRGRASMTPDTGRRAGIQLCWKCDRKDPDEDRPGRLRPAEGRLAGLADPVARADGRYGCGSHDSAGPGAGGVKEAAARDRLLGVLGTLAIVLTLAACTSPAPPPTGSAASARAAAPTAPGGISGSPPSPVTMADAKHCPVTLPRRVVPPSPHASSSLAGEARSATGSCGLAGCGRTA